MKPTLEAQRDIPKAIPKVKAPDTCASQERWGGNLIGFAPWLTGRGWALPLPSSFSWIVPPSVQSPLLGIVSRTCSHRRVV